MKRFAILFFVVWLILSLGAFYGVMATPWH